MSTDWNIHCIDCSETHGFNDANHMVDEMLALIRHAEAISLLAPLMAEPRSTWIEFRLGTYGDINPAWFAKHLGHQLLPIDEYGTLYGECGRSVTCKCGVGHKCTKSAGHDGEHYSPNAVVETRMQ